MNEDKTISSEFQINCGVQQGGISPPYLFSCFIDGLIEEITNRNVGALFKNLSIIVPNWRLINNNNNNNNCIRG
jgi:hypothetical protein